MREETRCRHMGYSSNLPCGGERTNTQDTSSVEKYPAVNLVDKPNEEIPLTSDTDVVKEPCSDTSSREKCSLSVSTEETSSKSEDNNEGGLSGDVKQPVRSSEYLKSDPVDGNSSSSDVEMAEVSLSIAAEDDIFNICDLIRPIFRSGGTPDSQISMKVRYDPSETVDDSLEDSPEKGAASEAGGRRPEEQGAVAVAESRSPALPDRTAGSVVRYNTSTETLTLQQHANSQQCDSEVQGSKPEAVICEADSKSDVSDLKLEIKDEDDEVESLSQEQRHMSNITNSLLAISESPKQEPLTSSENVSKPKTEGGSVCSVETPSAGSHDNVGETSVTSPHTATSQECSRLTGSESNGLSVGEAFPSLHTGSKPDVNVAMETDGTESQRDVASGGGNVAMETDGTVASGGVRPSVDVASSEGTVSVSHPSEPMSSPEGSQNSAHKQTISFLSPKSMDFLNKKTSREFPKDFAAIKEKLEGNLYKTVVSGPSVF